MVTVLLAIIGILILFFVVIMIVDGNRFVVKTYKIITDKTKHSHRLIVLADLHGKEYGENNEKLLKAIDEQRPTGILIAGDMLTAKPGAEFYHVLRFLGKLSEKYPIYYGNGNHEYRLKLYPDIYGDMGKEFEKGLNNISIFPLCNESTGLEDENIVIYGLEIDREYYKRGRKVNMQAEYLKEKLGTPDRNKYNILLAHNPVYFKTYANWGADLVVSGHVHGGMMRLPFLGGVVSPALVLFPKYSGGLYKEDNGTDTTATMVLSNGLGSHTLPIRIFNPGQLVVLEIDSE